MRQLMASAAGAYLGQAAVGTAQRSENTVVKNHLKQLALAMHNYHDVYSQFPPAAIRDAHGRALLSWRVALLPFIEEVKLYKQFHLDEPWDSPHNKPLIAQMPQTLRPRSATLCAVGKTTLVVPIGKQTIFGPPEGMAIRDITDGTSNTIMIVDADEAQAVIWTRPDDLNVDGVDAKRVVFGTRKEGVYCAFADGSVRRLGQNITAQLVHALLNAKRWGGDSPVSATHPRCAIRDTSRRVYPGGQADRRDKPAARPGIKSVIQDTTRRAGSVKKPAVLRWSGSSDQIDSMGNDAFCEFKLS